MFGLGLFQSFVKQRFRYFDQQQQLSDRYFDNKEFAKVGSQIKASKLTGQAKSGSVAEWAGQSRINASIVDAVSQSQAGPTGGDRVFGGRVD